MINMIGIDTNSDEKNENKHDGNIDNLVGY